MHHQGFTLIEVLISLIMLSLILLGFDAMEIYSLRSIRATYYFHLATFQWISIAERLRSIGSRSGIEEQVAAWNEQNKQLLPQGIGSVTGSYPNYTVTIYWGGMTAACQKIQLGQTGCLQQSIA